MKLMQYALFIYHVTFTIIMNQANCNDVTVYWVCIIKSTLKFSLQVKYN